MSSPRPHPNSMSFSLCLLIYKQDLCFLIIDDALKGRVSMSEVKPVQGK